MKLFGMLAALAAAVAALSAGPASAASPQACASMAGKTIGGLVIAKAAMVPAAAAGTVQVGFAPSDKNKVAFPAYCRIDGEIDGRTGAGGKHFGLAVAIALPSDWNGYFLMMGGGGLNGNLAAPLGPVAAGDRPALTRGFAVVSTDGGHRGGGFSDDFTHDQQAGLDFGFNAVPTVATTAKQVVQAYYRRPITRSFFTGCSTGGREGMEAAERYPFLFDGIITGAPAMRTDRSNLALKWAAVAFNRISPMDPKTGKVVPGGAFSPADRQLIIGAFLKACDELDGVKDGMVFDAGACRFDPSVLQCSGAKAEGCLNSDQVAALKTAFAGPITPDGRHVYSAHPYDTGMAMPGPIPGFLLNSTAGPVGGGVLPTSMDLTADEATENANALQQLIDTYNWTNLSSFYGHGGKQIFFHGLSDPWFSAYDTVDYYQRLAKDNGGPETLARSSRLFLVPGMGHCAGGPATLDQFDLLTLLTDWVVADKAPDSVVATGSDFPGRSRPLCPYPQHAQYRGAGDPEKASSFECRM